MTTPTGAPGCRWPDGDPCELSGTTPQGVPGARAVAARTSGSETGDSHDTEDHYGWHAVRWHQGWRGTADLLTWGNRPPVPTAVREVARSRLR